MKKLILFVFGLLILGASKAIAATPTFGTNSNSAYVISQSTIIVSSQSVVTSTYTGAFGGLRLGAVNGYRSVTLQFTPTSLQGGTSLFFMLNVATFTASDKSAIYNSGYMMVLSTQPYGVNVGGGNGLNTGSNYPNEITFETNGTIFGMTAVGVAPVTGRQIQKRIPQ